MGLTLLGLLTLVAGGELLIRGALALGQRVGLSPAVIGVVVVGAGTSVPELVVSVQAALAGTPALALGNVVGSNIYNVLLVLGLALLIRGCAVPPDWRRRDGPWLALSAIGLVLACLDGVVGRVDAVLGLVALVTWVVLSVRGATDEGEPGPPTYGAWIAALPVGAVVVALGAAWTIQGGTALATSLGVSERVIGLTVVALGTSLPELVTSCVAAARGESGIAVGNVAGSNIFNVLGVLAAAALVHPVDVAPRMMESDVWWALGATLMLAALLWRSRLGRGTGAVLVGVALVYTAKLATNSQL